MLRAIIFDFNGVILNDEPLHFLAMQKAVATAGINLDRQEYWDKYLPFDDWRCLDAICRDHAAQLTQQEREALLAFKSLNYAHLLEDSYPLFPGVADFVVRAASRYPLAIATGARREEVESTLAATGLADHFLVIVAAQDFKRGKPHPESFLFALECLNRRLNGRSPKIAPAECLVIEDSIGGIQGARDAGMACLAVANTYPREKLAYASRVAGSLAEVDVESLAGLLEGP